MQSCSRYAEGKKSVVPGSGEGRRQSPRSPPSRGWPFCDRSIQLAFGRLAVLLLDSPSGRIRRFMLRICRSLQRLCTRRLDRVSEIFLDGLHMDKSLLKMLQAPAKDLPRRSCEGESRASRRCPATLTSCHFLGCASMSSCFRISLHHDSPS